MKYFILLLFITTPLVLFTSEWTLFFYMGADNDLHRNAIEDIVEMQKGLLAGHEVLDIIVYIDHAPHYKYGAVEHIQVRPSSSEIVDSRILRTYPDENSGSGETLTRFLNWAYPRYASEKNILILWSHGSGWARDSMETRWIIEDSTAESNIKVYNGELREALERHNQRYDIIILDACFSGQIEMIGEIKEFADFVMASPETFPARGYPWIEIIPKWESGFSSFQVAELLASEFKKAYSMGGIYNRFGTSDIRVSVSVYDIAKYDTLFEAIKEFSEAFADAVYSPSFSSVRSAVFDYNWGMREIDLMQFVEMVAESSDFNHHPYKDKIEALKNSLDDFLVIRHSLFSTIYKSISIFYPLDFQDFISSFYVYWHHLRFSDSGWGRFLNYVYGVDIHPPNPVESINHTINLETIYIDWEEPVDPTPLTYRVVVSGTQASCLQYNIFADKMSAFPALTISAKISSDGYFTIEAIDEAGNISEPTKQYFFFNPVDNDKFYIAPNPVNSMQSEFTVFYYLTKPSSFINISLYNISGQLVWEERLGEHAKGEYNLHIEPFSTGVYFGIMTTENSRIMDRFAVIR